MTSAEATYRDLAAKDLKGLRLALLHGRMPAKERDNVMGRSPRRARRPRRDDRRRGRHRHPERDGDDHPERRTIRLAQLHQLRVASPPRTESYAVLVSEAAGIQSASRR